jgi:hypothetical protein
VIFLRNNTFTGVVPPLPAQLGALYLDHNSGLTGVDPKSMCASAPTGGFKPGCDTDWPSSRALNACCMEGDSFPPSILKAVPCLKPCFPSPIPLPTPAPAAFSFDCNFSPPSDYKCNQIVGPGGKYPSAAACTKVCSLPSTCTGESADLAAVECAAWQDLYDATNGPKWSSCSDARSDPCSCRNEGPGCHSCRVGCTGGHITCISLFGNNLRGTIPSSLAKLSEMNELRIDHNRLTGQVPSLPFAQYTNTSDGRGECALGESKGCTKPNCNHFKCPLPAGSEQCKYGSGSSTIHGVHCK